MKYQINRITYQVEICGSGFPFLLLHGFTGDSSTWTPFCEEWGSHSTLIMPDIIGHGKTESPPDSARYKMELVVNDLKDLLDQLKISKVDLLGYSMGGRLALAFALQYPDRVRRLILESSSPGLPSKEERELRRLNDNKLADFIIEKGVKSFVDYWEGIPLFSTMRHLPLKIRETIRSQRLSSNPVGLSGSLKGMGTGVQPSFWENLDKLQLPVLLVTGELDQKFCNLAKEMKKRLQNSSWIIIPKSGHANHVEEREKFVTIVSEFLKNT